MTHTPKQQQLNNLKVWVKVVSVAGQRLGLSMRDVDQKTGRDLLALKPASSAAAAGAGGAAGGSGGGALKTGLQGISGIAVNPDDFHESVKR